MASFGIVCRHHCRHHRQSHAYRRNGDFGHYLGCTDRRDQRKSCRRNQRRFEQPQQLTHLDDRYRHHHLARPVETGLGMRIGYLLISLFGKRTLGVGYSLALADLIIGPVTPSNTARGGAIVHPIMKSIALSFDSDPEKGRKAKSANTFHWSTSTPT